MPQTPPAARPLSRFRRVLWLYLAMAGLILLLSPADLLPARWWQLQGACGLVSIAAAAAAGLLLGLFFGRDIWRLAQRRNPLWKDALAVVLVLAGFAGLVLLRETGIWLWPFAAGNALALSMLATLSVTTALTERIKRVRVYAFARHYAFEADGLTAPKRADAP